MSTLHFTIKEDGKLYYLPNVPEEPKQVVICGGTHACTCASLAFENGANRDVVDAFDDNCQYRYKAALQKAKDNAIEVGNPLDIFKAILKSMRIGVPITDGYLSQQVERYIKPDTIYTLTGKYEVEINYFVEQSDTETGWMIISKTLFNAINSNPENATAVLKGKTKTKSVAFIKQQEELPKQNKYDEQELPKGNPDVKVWLKDLDEDTYQLSSAIQKAIPQLRRLGTEGKMVAARVIDEYHKLTVKPEVKEPSCGKDSDVCGDHKCKDLEQCQAEVKEPEQKGEETQEQLSFLLGKQISYRYVDWEQGSYTPWMFCTASEIKKLDDKSIDEIRFRP